MFHNIFVPTIARMDAAAQNLMGIVGCDSGTAEYYARLASGDSQKAVSLYFELGGAPPPPSTTKSSGDSKKHPCFEAVWGEKRRDVPKEWMQGFEFSEDASCRAGIVQHKNGPCGVIAVVGALLVSARLSCEDGEDEDDATKTTEREEIEDSPFAKTISDNELARAICTIIMRCADEEKYVLAKRKGKEFDFESHVVTSRTQLVATVRENIKSFRLDGGILLLVYSAVLTRGVERIRKDFNDSPSPLIGGRFNTCTFELMSLLMRGKANGDVGAFNQITKKPQDWTSGTNEGIGMLSAEFEKRVGIQLCNRLKTPTQPVWIVHGGDHFTVLAAASARFVESALDSKPRTNMRLVHYNGGPHPAGPRATLLSVNTPHGSRAATTGSHEETYYKPVPGQIDSVVQAHPGDKKTYPKLWTKWKYEVVLAVDDPTVDGAPRPPDLPPPKTYAQGPLPDDSTPWRCAKCYATRFKTMCFGQNEAGAKVCQHCSRKIQDCGFSIWLSYDALPSGWKASVTARHAPKIITLLQSKWPGAQVRVVSAADEACDENLSALPSI